MKLDQLCVNAIRQHPAFVIISAQTQLVLLICDHVLANHMKSSVFCSIDTAIERRFETLPGDFVLFLRHALGADLFFFANDKVTFRA